MKKITVLLIFITLFRLPCGAVFYKGARGDDIRELQIALYRKGYYNGVWDGEYSDGVCLAVREYQRDAGVCPDGVCTYALARSLGADVKYNEIDEAAVILARLACRVCKNGDYITKLAVCSVALNRVKSPLFPDSLVSVINGMGGAPPCEIPPDCMRAGYEASLGIAPYGDILYFEKNNTPAPPYSVRHGEYVFYR